MSALDDPRVREYSATRWEVPGVGHATFDPDANEWHVTIYGVCRPGPLYTPSAEEAVAHILAAADARVGAA